MLLYQKGPLNGILSTILGTDINVIWLADPKMAIITVAMLEIWNWTPFTFIIMLAGLSALPGELSEAARILGASRWRIFREVQLPLLRPVIFLAVILRFLEAIGEFPKTWALLQGGHGSATETIPVYLYLTTWDYFQISKGAAMSYLVMIVMVIIVLIAIRVLMHEKKSLDEMYQTAEAGE
jgi:multiple sugar transport system permease protein